MSEEVLNQEQVYEEDGYFDDVEEEVSEETETEDVVEETKSVEDTQSVEETQKETKPFMRVTYNKEDIDLDEDTTRTYAQKGMNYDKVLAERDDYLKTIKEQEVFNSRLEKLAKASGKDINAYIEHLENLEDTIAIDSELNALKEQYPDTDESILKELATSRVNGNRTKVSQETKAKEDKALEEHRADLKKQAQDFNSVYPNLDIKAMTEDSKYDDVWKLIDEKNLTLLEAFTIWSKSQEAKIKEQEDAKSSIAKKNEENKAKSLGVTNNVGDIEVDDFLSGWNSED